MRALLVLPFVMVAGMPPVPTTHVLAVTASEYSLQVVSTPVSGWTTVRITNKGTQPHHVVLTRLPDTMSLGEFHRRMMSDSAALALPDVGGSPIVAPGASGSAVMNLRPGRYGLTCWVVAPDGKPHIEHGMMTLIDVRTGADGGSAPSADVELHAADYHLAFSAPPHAGRQMVKFVNGGPQEHDVVILRLANGQTARDVLAWARAGGIGLPAGTVPVAGVAGEHPQFVAYFPMDLTPGRYVMFCIVPDAHDGKPHVLHNMITEFTVR